MVFICGSSKGRPLTMWWMLCSRTHFSWLSPKHTVPKNQEAKRR